MSEAALQARAWIRERLFTFRLLDRLIFTAPVLDESFLVPNISNEG